VTVGAERVGDDAWRWKVDPEIRPLAFWPRRPEWLSSWLSSIDVPVLAILAARPEPPGRDATPAAVRPFLPARGRLEVFDAGHLIPFERPHELADLVAEFVRT
jgi:pimeloyl-ACP methyl ester carboxylesterase